MSRDFSFPYFVPTLHGEKPCEVTVLARIEDEAAGCEIGFQFPVGVSQEVLSRVALLHYDYKFEPMAWDRWRELRGEITDQRHEAGIAGTEPAEEAV